MCCFHNEFIEYAIHCQSIGFVCITCITFYPQTSLHDKHHVCPTLLRSSFVHQWLESFSQTSW
jgi:hypothetical protein